MDRVSFNIELNEMQLRENSLRENIERLQEYLAKQPISGLYIDFNENTNRLIISMGTGFFDANKHNARKGGRRKVRAVSKTEKELSITGIEIQKRYNYSDIVLKLSQGTDLKEMLNFTNLSQATYYRHLKSMKESSYYKSLDLERCTDADYLESVPGNRLF